MTDAELKAVTKAIELYEVLNDLFMFDKPIGYDRINEIERIYNNFGEIYIALAHKRFTFERIKTEL